MPEDDTKKEPAAADDEPPVPVSPMERLQRLEEKVFGAASDWSFPKKKDDKKKDDAKKDPPAPPPATTPAGLAPAHPSEKADQGATGVHKR